MFRGPEADTNQQIKVKDRKQQQREAAYHDSGGFNRLALRLLTGASPGCKKASLAAGKDWMHCSAAYQHG